MEGSLGDLETLVETLVGHVGWIPNTRQIDKVDKNNIAGLMKVLVPVLATTSSSLINIQGGLAGVPALFNELAESWDRILTLENRVHTLETAITEVSELASNPLAGEMNRAGITQQLYGNAAFAALV